MTCFLHDCFRPDEWLVNIGGYMFPTCNPCNERYFQAYPRLPKGASDTKAGQADG